MAIKWKQSDYMQLGKAVKQFNRKILELETDENQAFLPDMQNYKEMKESIKTRQELNRYIKSLNRFKKESTQKIIEVESGEKLTVWEQREIQKMATRALTQVNKEIAEQEKPTESGYSMAQMGSLEVNRLKKQAENIKGWQSKTQSSFRRNIESIKNLGRLDYDYRKAEIYQQNYKDEMAKYSSYDNYQLFEKFVNRYKNPISFWNRVKNHEVLKDLTYQSEQTYSQAEFNSFLVKDIGIDSEKLKNIDAEELKKLKEEK